MTNSIDMHTLPKHIALIMDGNGRWAQQRGASRIFGHRNGTKAVREVIEECAKLGISYLTLYAFSTENWSRPRKEVNGLMQLLVSSLRKELDTLQENNVRLTTIGDTTMLPKGCQLELNDTIAETSDNNGLNLILALNYSGHWDILQATKKLAEQVKKGLLDSSSIDEEMFASFLSTTGVPDPELLIRTSGEIRISNFLLWQIAYSELYFTDILWPDFRKNHLLEAIDAYQHRERRFGNISEQVKI